MAISTRNLTALSALIAIVFGACETTETPTVISPDPEVSCITSGDQSDILAALTGPGAHAVLCPNSVFELTEPIEYTAAEQEIYTQGFPDDDSRALLRIVADPIATAVDGMWLDRVQLRNVRIDGGRQQLGMLPDGPALVNFGYNASGQIIEGVEARHPRGWVALYVNEGSEPLCDSAIVRNNVVHTAGSLYSRVDGISIACPNSLVEGNTVIDATDGGFVIFQAPGSLIQNNTIRAEEISLSYAISMVDYMPFSGDYSGTRVLNNTIDAAGAVIKTGIAMGDPTGCPSDVRSRGAEVRGNILTGSHMGYGFPVMGVEDWTVLDNVDQSTHVLVTPEEMGCIDFEQPPATGFQIDLTRSSGTFQAEYQNTQLGLLLEPFGEEYVFSPNCMSALLGADVFNEIRDGQRGEVFPAIEQAPGGRFLEQCIEIFEIPAQASDAVVTLSLQECDPTCVILELRNTASTAADMTAAAFLMDNFLVGCTGIPASIPADETATCQIDDFVYVGAPLLAAYGFKAVPRIQVFGYPITP